MGILKQKDNAIIYEQFGEKVIISHYGPDRIRFRSTANGVISDEAWTLLPPENAEVEIEITDGKAVMKNGLISVEIDKDGAVIYYDADGKILLAEKYLDFREKIANLRSARVYRHRGGSVYETDVYFKPQDGEHFYGLGQDTSGCLDLKGSTKELFQKNTHVSIPFLLSSKGYGFIWNNPAVGRVETVKNHTLWHMEAAAQVDYIVIAKKTPADIVRSLSGVTGFAPEFPEWASGFWQCKLRYQTQDELMNVAREYKKRNIPLSVIIADFFHWTEQGDFKFDPKYWPDPKAMVEELKEMGIRLFVSIWPTVSANSENYGAFADRNCMAYAETGGQSLMLTCGSTFIDPTNPEAREYIWDIVRKNYCEHGIRSFWLDVAEPELLPYHFENMRTYLGNGMQVGQIFPFMYEKMFYDGLKSLGETEIVSLCRSAWLGSQRFGVLVWSGDIPASFDSFRRQIKAGLNISVCGIPWWNTDIGGFVGGYSKDPEFRELLVRWFQFGIFTPVTRMHGWREWGDMENTTIPDIPQSGAYNEIWSYGDEVYEILKDLIELREKLRPYIHRHMKRASADGTPLMRPMFFDFPGDPVCYVLEDQYMFGDDILVAPVTELGSRSREVYLPKGRWVRFGSAETYEGGCNITCEVPLDSFAAFVREGAEVF